VPSLTDSLRAGLDALQPIVVVVVVVITILQQSARFALSRARARLVFSLLLLSVFVLWALSSRVRLCARVV